MKIKKQINRLPYQLRIENKMILAKIKQKDIAKALNVTEASISRVINHQDNVILSTQVEDYLNGLLGWN